MIGEVLSFLRQHVDEHLRAQAEDVGDDTVVFLDGDKVDPISFKLGAVTLLLVNVEEERVLRNADPYVRVNESGGVERVQPDIRLVLYPLFVARFKQYDTGWSYLSRIIEHFQTERVFERETTPDLPDGVEKLVFELVTLGFAEQNEVWNALRTTHLPSILYRVKLLAFRDRKPRSLTPMTEPSVTIKRTA
jgi:hypothetical protein